MRKLFLAIALLGIVATGRAQVTVSLSPVAKQQFFSVITGLPLAGGKICTYQAGTTSPLTTYTNSTGTSQNTNPITLDSQGFANMWLINGFKYKFALYDSTGTAHQCNGNLQWTVDNVSVPASTSSGGGVTGIALNGTANQIIVDGPSPITTSGSWTIHFPLSGATMPGTTIGLFSGSLLGNAATSTSFLNTPTTCSTPQFTRFVLANGNAHCDQPAFSELSGTATAGQLPATVVFSNQANAFTTGIQDFSAAADLYVPSLSVGLHNGDIGIDSNGNYHGFAGGADSIFASMIGSSTYTNGDCPVILKSGSFVSIGDNGAPCGSGGGGGGVSAVSSGNFAPFFNVTVGTPTTTPAFSYTAISQTANKFAASPDGSSGAFSARAIVKRDVPFVYPNSGTPLCYASYFGNDSTGDGLSWGTALNSVMACYDLLPAAGGTIYMADGGTGNPIPACKSGDPAGCGIWIMGTADPNYASPPAGWRQARKAVDFVGVAGSCNFAFATGPQVCVSGGGSTPTTPALWMSDVFTHTFSSMVLGSAHPGVLGVDSNLNLSDAAAASWDNEFDNVAFQMTTGAGHGPSLVVAGSSAWNFFNHCQFQGNGNEISTLSACTRTAGVSTCTGVATFPGGSVVLPSSWSGTLNVGIFNVSDPTFDGIQAITVTSSTQFTFPQAGLPNSSATGGSASSDASEGIIINPLGASIAGSGLFRLTNAFFEGAGVREYSGNAGGDAFLDNPFQEGGYTPIVHYIGCTGGSSDVQNAYQSDIVITSASVWTDKCPTTGTPPSVYNSTFYGPAIVLSGSTTATYPDQTQSGIIGKKVFAQVDDARRQFGVVSTRFLNTAATLPSSWLTTTPCATPTSTTSADPSGGTNAGTYSGGSGTLFACWAKQTINFGVGDTLIAGVWAKSNNSNGYAGAIPATLDAGGHAIFGGAAFISARPNLGGVGEWDWISTQATVTVAGSVTVTWAGNASSTHPTDFAFPVFIYIPAGTLTPSEVYEYGAHLQSYRSDSTVGQASLLPGKQLLTDSAVIRGLTPGGCVQVGSLGLLTTTVGGCGTSTGTITATGVPAAFQTAIFSGVSSITGIGPGTAGQVWTSNGAGVNPSFQTLSSSTATNLAGGALGSSPYQTAPGLTGFLASPTIVGHTFALSWQPAGSAIAPIALDLGTYLASPPAIGGTTPAPINGSKLTTMGNLAVGGPIPYIDPRAPPYLCAEDGSTDDTACMTAAFNAAMASTTVHEIYISGTVRISAPMPPITTRGLVIQGCHGDRPGNANGGGCGIQYHTTAPTSQLNVIQLGNPKQVTLLTLSRNNGTSQVTATFTTPPAGSGTFQAVGKVNISGALNGSFNGGPFTINSINYGTNTVVWGQAGTTTTTTGGIMAAPYHDTNPGYDGIQGLEIKDLEIQCSGATTPLDNGVNTYCNNVAAIADYRGGSVKLRNVQIEQFNWGFWGVQSDIDRFFNFQDLYNHRGIFLLSDSDQFIEEGEMYSLYDDIAVYGSGVHGMDLQFLNSVDEGTAAGCEVEIGDAYTATAGDPNDNSNASDSITIEKLWHEHSGNPPASTNCMVEFGSYDGVPNITQFTNQYNSGLYIGQTRFKTRPQSGSAFTTYGVQVGNADFVFLDSPLNGNLGVTPTGAFKSWFNFVGGSTISPQQVKIRQFDEGTLKATVPPTLFTNSGAGTPSPYYVPDPDGSSQTTLTTTATVSLDDGYFSSVVLNQDATAGAAITATLPTARPGMKKCFANSDGAGGANTGILRVNTSATGQFIHTPTGNSTSGGFISSAGAAGDWGCFIGISATAWQFTASSGSWTPH